MVKGLRGHVVLAGMLLSLLGCLQEQVADQGTVVDTEPAVAQDPDTLVCNPLNEGTMSQSREQGVHGQLFYVAPGGPQYPTVADYIQNATPVEVDLFFNQLYVPTRPFDRGFVTQAGNAIQAADGTSLYEWFAIRFQGRLQLGMGQSPGAYQLAILSDDGSVLDVDQGAGVQRLVDNDGWHPTRLACATEPLHLAAGQKIPFQLDYFQGPRFHIALVMLWRPWPTDPALVNDPNCGVQGNGTWFDYRQDPPPPTARYQSLLASGWQVVAPENLVLPATEESNPCNDPAPVLSGITVGNVQRSGATVSWISDRPSTSQLVLTEVTSQTQTLTTEDQALVTAHTVVLSGLKANTVYRVKAVSRSASGLSAETNEITFRTAR